MLHTNVATPDCTPDSEVFPITIMCSSLKGKGWEANCVWPIEGVECKVIDLNSLHMGLLVEHFFDNNIEGNLIQLTLQAVSQQMTQEYWFMRCMGCLAIGR